MKTFNNFLIVLASLALSAGAINAQTWQIGTPNAADVTAILTDGTLIIDGTGKMQDFSEENAPWYDVRHSIQNLIISEKITSIGDFAFLDCNVLIGDLYIPNFVKTIGNGAFENCSGLSGLLYIPNTVRSIGDYAFRNCSGFTSIKLSNSLMYLGYQAFVGCNYGRRDKYNNDDYYRQSMLQKMLEESGNIKY